MQKSDRLLDRSRRIRRARRAFFLRGGDDSVGIHMSGGSIAENASVGDPVGTFSILNASGNWLDPITYTLTDDAGGKYAIDGDDLEVADALSDGTDSITVEADNGTDTPITRTFSITVTAVVVPGDGPIMDFSVAGNPYLVLLEDF